MNRGQKVTPRLRRMAIRILRDTDLTQTEVARELRLSQATVRKIWIEYKETGKVE